jgi:hypothetical protein
MAKYRKKPVVIEAIQYQRRYPLSVIEFAGSNYPHELLEEIIRQLNDCDEHREEWPDLTKAYFLLTRTLLKQNIISTENLDFISTTSNEKITK